jgi:hypothetical protein
MKKNPIHVREEEVNWLLTHRRKDVLSIVKAFRNLPPSKRRNFGVGASYLVSMLEKKLKEKRSKRASK